MHIHLDVVEFEENIIFGCQMHVDISDIINFCLVIAKYN